MWSSYTNKIHDLLSNLSVTERNGTQLEPSDGFRRWVDIALRLKENGAFHLIGNGASASMASHFAADITKNCHVRAVVFTDCALITAMGNDYGFENCYSVALGRYARLGDCLVAISSSGNSPNIVAACKKADEMGITVVTLSGMKPDNRIRKMGALNFHVPAESYSLAESAHSIVLHHWTDLLEHERKKD